MTDEIPLASIIIDRVAIPHDSRRSATASIQTARSAAFVVEKAIVSSWTQVEGPGVKFCVSDFYKVKNGHRKIG